MRQIGLEPVMVLEIINDGISTFISTIEFMADQSPFNKEILPLAKSFSAYTSIAREDGFGSRETMSIELLDYFGNFKELLETVEIHDLYANIYLVVKQPPLKPEAYQLIKGRISDPIEWNENDRILSIGVISSMIFDEFGFKPDWPNHQNIMSNLVDDPWPHVFGDLASYNFKPICNTPTTELTQGIAILSPDLQGNFYPYENTSEYSIYNEGTNFLQIPINNGGSFPAWSEGTNYYEINMPGGTVLFKARNFGISLNMDSVADWNIPYYANICVWSPLQYNGFLPYTKDNADYIPNTMMLTGYGTFKQVNTFNIYGELSSWPNTVQTEFPFIGFNPDQSPDLTNHYILFTAFRTYLGPNDVRRVEYILLWGRVTSQQDLTITINDITDTYGNQYSLSGFRPCYIHCSMKNKVFYPSTALAIYGGGSTMYGNNSQLRWPLNDIKKQVGDNSDGIFFSRGNGIYDRVYLIEMGAQIQPVNWWPTTVYPVSLDTITDVTNVYIKNQNKLTPLNLSQFYVVTYSRLNGWDIVTTGIPSNSWIPSILYGMEPEDLPEECTFVIVRPSIRNVDTVLITCGNVINTDEEVFKFIVERYTTLTASVNPNTYYHHKSQMIIRRQESVTSTIGSLAWEHAKQIRVVLDHATLIDYFQPMTPLLTFAEANVENGGLIISYTQEENIKNYLVATPADNWTIGTLILRNRASIERFTELRESFEIGFNRIYSETDDNPDPMVNADWPENNNHLGRGYNRVLAYWLYKSSHIWMQLKFNTFIDSIVVNKQRLLVGADPIKIDFSMPVNFVNETIGLPFNVKPLYGSGSLPKANGYITELTISPSDWTVSINVDLPIMLGSNTPQYIREE